jgi:hypothetical protein
MNAAFDFLVSADWLPVPLPRAAALRLTEPFDA